ncbi:bifunctional adenosylcobinamide kinase/adenosylcobinamide-phosphate guanylyltransferase [Synechococcus sp. PROS-U-1]|uniref:bifunctional adenosylcobinamide kinase/adenosylcobinamide-phosphate guanylyltransferase n=1 Tax=Synechococcus sp. PROS-U-1 TaxID=1400866 RepID=UPI0016461F76|nr:bifunctional adenosylcobinamide kinase/adenosylcobinamide-phosphate guanylyltransferase [Synechococcus sp. PROS-U-1]QNJ03174.1 bifunctional adenosylcobinamide kinase / adenosylcobinamide-phosphate guanylyltransferase [Synechococcus sp. PROS-U-1]
MAVVDPKARFDQPITGSNSQLILVSGPARSGKSRWAEHLLNNHPVVTYIATAAARPEDLDWQQRLDAHRQRRPEHWTVAESGGELVEVMKTLVPGQSVLIDALGGFVAHHLELDASDWSLLCERLIASITSSRCICVLVIEETGWGVVPPTRIGGLFRDRLGALAQDLDRIADAAWLVVQGRALDLHGLGCLVP